MSSLSEHWDVRCRRILCGGWQSWFHASYMVHDVVYSRLQGIFFYVDQTCPKVAYWPRSNRRALFWDVTIAFEAQYGLTNNLSKNGWKMEQDSFSRPLWAPWITMGAAFGARRQQKRRIQGSRFPLEPLLGSILKAHDGLDGFPKGFGRGLERTLLQKLIFEGCL